MSYDIWLRPPAVEPCPTCGHRVDGNEPERLDPTYNMTPLFDAALTGEDLPNPDVSEGAVVLFRAKTDRPRGLRLLSGKKAADTVTWLAKALSNLKDPGQREKFLALEPPNKWGDLPGAIWVIERMLANAREYPDNTWEIQ
jgi:hypothetical protein